jgi:hypothetical protein
LDAKNQGY